MLGFHGHVFLLLRIRKCVLSQFLTNSGLQLDLEYNGSVNVLLFSSLDSSHLCLFTLIFVIAVSHF
jgi:hypothetical protein